MIYRTSTLTIDTRQYQLSRGNEQVDVEPQVFDLLVFLVENRDRVVSRSELLDTLWKGRVVSDSALSARLKAARKAVGDSGDQQAVIKTVHGRGYQFVGEVTESSKDEVERNSGTSSTSREFLSLPEKPSVAVLPFQNLSNDSEQEYFSDGITEDIITALSTVRDLMVIARSSTSVYKGKAVDIKQVGQEQGVQYVLEGSVRKAGTRVRVTAQLVDATAGHQLWAERYDRDLEDIFAVQDEITREVVVALDVRLSGGEGARMWSGGTKNLEAWECVRQGMNILNHVTGESPQEAQRLCKKALDLDPKYAMAWVNLGWAYHNSVDVGVGFYSDESRETALASGLDCGKKALELDPSCADAYCLLSLCHLSKGEYDQASAMSEKAVRLAPNYAEILAVSAIVQNKSGRAEQSLDLIRKAIRLCPIYPGWFLWVLGIAYRLTGQTDSAVTAFEAAIKRDPNFLASYVNLASMYGELGQEKNTRKLVSEILRLDPNFSIEKYLLGLSYKDPREMARFEDGLHKAGLPQ